MAKWTPKVEEFDSILRSVHAYKCLCISRFKRPPAAECALLRRELFVALENMQKQSAYEGQYHYGDKTHYVGDDCKKVISDVEFPVCSICRTRHPSDERHPCE